MASTQPVPARQDSAFIDDIEKKDVDTPSSNEKLGDLDTPVESMSGDDASEQIRLKEVEELEVCISPASSSRSCSPRFV